MILIFSICSDCVKPSAQDSSSDPDRGRSPLPSGAPQSNTECDKLASAGLPEIVPRNHNDNDICPTEFDHFYCVREHTPTVFCSSVDDLAVCRVKNCLRRCSINSECSEFCEKFKFPVGVCYNNYCDCRATGNYGIDIDHSLGTCTEDSNCKNFCKSSYYTQYRSVCDEEARLCECLPKNVEDKCSSDNCKKRCREESSYCPEDFCENRAKRVCSVDKYCTCG